MLGVAGGVVRRAAWRCLAAKPAAGVFLRRVRDRLAARGAVALDAEVAVAELRRVVDEVVIARLLDRVPQAEEVAGLYSGMDLRKFY